jgi:hypothetical protein
VKGRVRRRRRLGRRLLRRLQPALGLDEAGPLPLPAHGSMAKGVLAVAA